LTSQQYFETIKHNQVPHYAANAGLNLKSINYSDLTNQDIVYPLPKRVFKIANRKSGE
jgi:hypothetical protein